MRKSLFLLLLIACVSLVPCERVQASDDIYAFYIGTNRDGFEDDSTANASGDAILGEVFVHLNGNPVAFYGGYGKIMQINQWIKKGKNTFRFKGVASKDLYFKIAKYDQDDNRVDILAKEHIEPGSIDTIGEFIAGVSYRLPFFSYSIAKHDANVNNEIQKEVVFLKSIIDPEYCI